VGGIRVVVTLKDHRLDLLTMARAITPLTKLVFIANPNNPTGTLLAPVEIEAFLRAVPPHVVVVLDEAYNEYLPAAARYDSIAWLARDRNLILTRTFSKAYGLAGLRVGFALCDEKIADLLNRVRQPFNVNSIAQAAAVAALADDDHLKKARRANTDGMRQLVKGFEHLGLPFIPSVGNFVCVEVGGAEQVYEQLLRAGVIVRPVANYGMPNHLRVTVGLPDENERFLRALEIAARGK
jgi:histidinol-phosphate aminotransferase